MEAYTYYVNKGDNNRVAELPKLDPADGLIAVTITSIEKDYFLENWGLYYWDSNGELQSPQELPSHSQAMLRLTISTQADQIKELTADNIQLKADNEALKTGNEELKSANELTQQGLMEAVDYLSSQLTPASTTTGTDSTATSSAAPASSEASES